MDEPKDDGGAAFPQITKPSTRNAHAEHFGLSIRDYFAAARLQSILRHRDNQFLPDDDAAWCYRVADAMVRERAK